MSWDTSSHSAAYIIFILINSEDIQTNKSSNKRKASLKYILFIVIPRLIYQSCLPFDFRAAFSDFLFASAHSCNLNHAPGEFRFQLSNVSTKHTSSSQHTHNKRKPFCMRTCMCTLCSQVNHMYCVFMYTYTYMYVYVWTVNDVSASVNLRSELRSFFAMHRSFISQKV